MTVTENVSTSPDVLMQQVGDEAVLLDLASGTYFGLDAVGVRIWELLAQGKSLADLTDALLQEYEVTRADLERDVERLLADLEQHGLVKTRPC